MAIITQAIATPSSSPSPSTPTGNLILQEIKIDDGGELVILATAEVTIIDNGSSSQMEISAGSTTTFR